MASKVTIHSMQKMKEAGERITMLTCYDATFANLLDGAGVDVLLVGDSLGNVIQGEESTLPVTVDQIIYHLKAVNRRVSRRAHVVGDMPFMSYQTSIDEAVRNAGRLVAEGGAECVKLEGGAEFGDVVRKIVRAGIPVMGHLGLTPQSVHRMGGYVIQGRDEEKAKRLMEDAIALQEAGCSSIVLEGIPAAVAEEITRTLTIPTIGIGAGPGCDGQVLVIYDLLGMNPSFSPKFVKRYADLHQVIGGAVRSYVDEVRGGAFPTEAHSFAMKPAAKAAPAQAGVDEGEKVDALYGGGAKASGREKA